MPPRTCASGGHERRALLHALAIFLVSFGILTTEIALTRVFSYAISYHFAYLTISTALLGFGGAGSLLAAFPDLFGGVERRIALGSTLGAVATVVTLAFCSVVQFDPNELGHDPTGMLVLLLYSVVVTVPFLLGGLVVATVLTVHSGRVGMFYAYDLLGAALGCGISVPLIWSLETPAAVVVGALALAVAGVVAAGGHPRPTRLAAAGLVVTLTGGLLTVALGPFPPSPGKFLALLLADDHARHLYHQWTPISRVDVVGWEPGNANWKGSYAAAGVGAGFEGAGPAFRMIGYDGGSFAAMYAYDGGDAGFELFRHHVLAAPYQIRTAPRVLVIGLGGGADAMTAIANGAGPITGLELNPVTVRLGREDYASFVGGLFDSDRLTVVTAEARHWVEASPAAYDVIVLNSIDTFAALSSGAYVLAESYLYTTEAFTRYLGRLAPEGVFSLVSFDNAGVAGPTFIVLRFVATLVDALARLGVAEPEAGIVVLASRETVPLVSMLVKRTPFSAAELDALTAFAEREGFDFWHRPDHAVPHQVGAYLRERPEARTAFHDAHYLRLTPATDDSPFFFNFYKWGSLLWPDPRDQGTNPATGQRMLLLMLVEAIVLSAAIILWPLRRLRRGRPVPKPLGTTLYFAGLGVGFILIEISLLQRFVLFLGFPTYSLSVVLFSLLTCTGIGSALSTRIIAPWRGLPIAAVALLAALIATFVAFAPAAFAAFLERPLPVRIVATVLMIAPLGLLLGTFFPLGVRLIEADDPRLVAWAWAINGCATVVGTILAVILAMSLGFTTVMALALGIYLIGALGLAFTPRPRPPLTWHGAGGSRTAEDAR